MLQGAKIRGWATAKTSLRLNQWLKDFKARLKINKTIEPLFTCEAAAFYKTLQFVHAYGSQSSHGLLWISRIRYPLDPNNKMFSGEDLDTFESKDLGYHYLKQAFLGRLVSSLEGEGKRRVFAISNYINKTFSGPYLGYDCASAYKDGWNI